VRPSRRGSIILLKIGLDDRQKLKKLEKIGHQRHH